MENHHFQWENRLFLWPFSIAMLNYQRVHPFTTSAWAKITDIASEVRSRTYFALSWHHQEFWMAMIIPITRLDGCIFPNHPTSFYVMNIESPNGGVLKSRDSTPKSSKSLVFHHDFVLFEPMVTWGSPNFRRVSGERIQQVHSEARCFGPKKIHWLRLMNHNGS
jgi:hypothetical protein